MSKANRFNRIFRFSYPGIVFLVLLLSWSMARPLRGFAASRMPNLEEDGNPYRNPERAQLICSAARDSFLGKQACEMRTLSKSKLIDTNRIFPRPIEQAFYERDAEVIEE